MFSFTPSNQLYTDYEESLKVKDDWQFCIVQSIYLVVGFETLTLWCNYLFMFYHYDIHQFSMYVCD